MRTKIITGIILSAVLCVGCVKRQFDIGDGADYAAPTPAAAFEPIPSVINIPAEIKMAHVEKMITDLIPQTIYRSDLLTFAGFKSVSVDVQKNGGVKARARGDELLYIVPLKIILRVRIAAPVIGGQPLFQENQTIEAGININLKTKISLGNDWRLTTKTTATDYSWTAEPVIKTRRFNIPVKPVADFAVSKSLGAIGEAVDRAISRGLNAKDVAAPFWNELQKPMEISLPGLDDRLWLRIGPEDIYVAQPAGHGNMVTAALGIRANVEAFIGEKPDTRAATPLPNFKTPSGNDSAFAINVYPQITFAQATAICRETIAGQTFRSGKQKIKVHDIEISAQNGLALVKMDVSGSLNGTVRVIGKAVYDEPTQTLSIDDFDFDLETKSKFMNSRNWFVKGIIMSKMKPHLKFPLGEKLDAAKTLAQEALTNHKLPHGLALNGKIDKITVRGVEMTDNAFRLAVAATGSAKVSVKGD